MPWDGRLDDLPDEWEKFISETKTRWDDDPPYKNGKGKSPPSLGWWRDKLRRYDEYCDMVLPPIKYVVQNLFPEGVSLIVGRPKIGK